MADNAGRRHAHRPERRRAHRRARRGEARPVHARRRRARELGLHTLRSGDLVAFVSVGPANPRELTDVFSDTEALRAIAEATGGSVRRVAAEFGDGVVVPRIQAVRSGTALCRRRLDRHPPERQRHRARRLRLPAGARPPRPGAPRRRSARGLDRGRSADGLEHDPLGLKQRLKAATRPAQFPSPLWGRTTRPKAERGGVAGHRAPGRSRPAVHQPQGKPNQSARPKPLRLTHLVPRRSGARCPATPFSLGLRPSRSSPRGRRSDNSASIRSERIPR